jgi:hypothetical protein
MKWGRDNFFGGGTDQFKCINDAMKSTLGWKEW